MTSTRGNAVRSAATLAALAQTLPSPALAAAMGAEALTGFVFIVKPG